MAWFKPGYPASLNVAHPHARGLICAMLFNEPNGTQAVDASGRGLHGTITNMSRITGAEGYGLEGTTTNAEIELDGDLILDGGTEFTALVCVTPDAITADRGLFYTDGHAGGEPILFWLDNAGTDHIAGLINTSAGTTGADYTSYVPSSGVQVTTALTWRSGEPMRCYVDGVEDTGGGFPSASLGGTLDTSGSTYKWFKPETSGKGFDGKVWYAFLWERCLGANEIASLYHDPYQMFRFPDFLTAYGGGAPPVTATAGPLVNSVPLKSLVGGGLVS